MSNDIQTLSFEAAFGDLEVTVEQLEAGELTLEEAIALYERGMRLAQRCNEALDAAELQIQQLTTANNQQQQLGMFFEHE